MLNVQCLSSIITASTSELEVSLSPDIAPEVYILDKGLLCCRFCVNFLGALFKLNVAMDTRMVCIIERMSFSQHNSVPVGNRIWEG